MRLEGRHFSSMYTFRRFQIQVMPGQDCSWVGGGGGGRVVLESLIHGSLVNQAILDVGGHNSMINLTSLTPGKITYL